MSEQVPEQKMQNNNESSEKNELRILAFAGIMLIVVFVCMFFYASVTDYKTLTTTYIEGILPEDYCEVYRPTEERAAAIHKAANRDDVPLHRGMSMEHVVSVVAEPDQIFRAPYDGKYLGTEYRYWLKYDKSEDPNWPEHYEYEGLEVIFDKDDRFRWMFLMHRRYRHRPDNTRVCNAEWH